MAKKIKPHKSKKEAPVDAPFDNDRFVESLKTALAYDPRKKKKSNK